MEKTPFTAIGLRQLTDGDRHSGWHVAGAQISTETIWNLHRTGHDYAAITRKFPALTEADVRAAVRFEADSRKFRWL